MSSEHPDPVVRAVYLEKELTSLKDQHEQLKLLAARIEGERDALIEINKALLDKLCPSLDTRHDDTP